MIEEWRDPVERRAIEVEKNVLKGIVLSEPEKRGDTTFEFEFEHRVDRRRTVTTYLKTGNVTRGPWDEFNARPIVKRTKTITKKTRVRMQEEKTVSHHDGHSWSGFSSRRHTHYDIYRIQWTVEWIETIDFDGTVRKTAEVEIPRTRTRRHIGGDRERGWSDPYVKDIQ